MEMGKIKIESERERKGSKMLILIVLYTLKFHPILHGYSATDKTASDNIMNEVRKALKRSHYNFTHEMQSARIITGEEEAIGGWNTANYLSRNFKHPVSVCTYMYMYMYMQ